MTLDELARRVRQFATYRLPATLSQPIGRAIERLPLRLELAGPVLQAYVADGLTKSFVGIHNFYSVLLPERSTDAVAEATFYDAAGKRIVEHELAVPHFGAATIDVSALFASRSVRSDVGVVAVQLTPRRPRDRAYRELGRVTSHFFVHFESSTGAVGQIHPLSTQDVANRASGPFRSSQLITTDKLESLDVIQYNATGSHHRLEHRLVDPESGAVFRARTTTLAPLGAAIVRFELRDLSPPPRLLLTLDDLPSANAKPVLRRLYADGLYSLSHA